MLQGYADILGEIVYIYGNINLSIREGSPQQ
jgi:hypothetical protein